MKKTIEETTVEVEVNSHWEHPPGHYPLEKTRRYYVEAVRLWKHELRQARLETTFLEVDDRLGALVRPVNPPQEIWTLHQEIEKWVTSKLQRCHGMWHDGCYGTGYDFDIGNEQFTELAVTFILEFCERFGIAKEVLDRKLKIYRTTLVHYGSIGYITYAHHMLVKRGVSKTPHITHLTGELSH